MAWRKNVVNGKEAQAVVVLLKAVEKSGTKGEVVGRFAAWEEMKARRREMRSTRRVVMREGVRS